MMTFENKAIVPSQELSKLCPNAQVKHNAGKAGAELISCLTLSPDQ